MELNTIKNLTDDELKICFDEIADYRQKGIMSIDTLTRKVRSDIAKEIGVISWDLGCDSTSNYIMFEIAKRHYGVS